MTDQLRFTLQEAARLASETADALNRGDMEAAGRLQQEAERAWQRARKLGQQHAKRPTLSKTPSVRERTIAAVMELDVPCSPKLIAAYCVTRNGEPFDVRAIASIRRDERRSWNTGARRDTYLVPALEGPWFVAARGRFALSHWPLWQRIVGPLSPRADHLRVCRHLVDQIESVGQGTSEAERLGGLLAEYARSVPGALESAPGTELKLDLARVREAVLEELDLLEVEDESQRRQEAERAQRTLNDTDQLWGGAVPEVIGNNTR
jgi:hypothetical protein